MASQRGAAAAEPEVKPVAAIELASAPPGYAAAAAAAVAATAGAATERASGATADTRRRPSSAVSWTHSAMPHHAAGRTPSRRIQSHTSNVSDLEHAPSFGSESSMSHGLAGTGWRARLREAFPRASEQVRSAPFIVQVQAFLKLSFEQFESDDLSFKEAAEEATRLEVLGSSPSTDPLLGMHLGELAALGTLRRAFTGRTRGDAAAATEAAAAAAVAAAAEAGDAADQTEAGAGGGGGDGDGVGPGAAKAGKGRRPPEAAVVSAVGATPGKLGLAVDVTMKPTLYNYTKLLLVDVVHPNSMARVLWDFMYLGINLWIAAVLPLLIVFVSDLYYTTSLGAWELTIDVMCMMDVLFYCRTAVILDDFRVKASRLVIVRHYLRHWALLDVAACLPFLTLITAPGEPLSRAGLRFRLLRLTKLLRLPHVLACSNVQAYVRAKVLRTRGVVPLVLLLWVVLVTMHHAACYWYFLGVVATHNTMLPPEDDPDDPTSWVVQQGLVNLTAAGKYISAVYFTMYTFFTVGYGNVAVVSIPEKVYAMVIAVIGIIMVGWFMGALASHLGSGTSGRDQRAQDVFQFLRKRRVTGTVARRLRKYTDLASVTQLTEEERAVIEGLPRMLRTEVVISLFQPILYRIPFTLDRPPQFVVDMLLRLQLRLYAPGDYVVAEGEIGDEVYLLAVGELRVQRALDVTKEPGRRPRGRFSYGDAGTAGGGGGGGAGSGPPGSARKRMANVALAALSLVNVSGAARRTAKAGLGAKQRSAKSLSLPASSVAGALQSGPSLPSLARDSQLHTMPQQLQQPGRGLEPWQEGLELGPAQEGAQLAAPGGAAEAKAGAAAGPQAAKDVPPARLAATCGALGRLYRATQAAAAQAARTEGGPGRPKRWLDIACIAAQSEPTVDMSQMREARPKHEAGEGAVFGFASCMLRLPRRNSVVAVTPSEVAVLRREDMEALMADWPQVYDDPTLQPSIARRHSFCLREHPVAAGKSGRVRTAAGQDNSVHVQSLASSQKGLQSAAPSAQHQQQQLLQQPAAQAAADAAALHQDGPNSASRHAALTGRTASAASAGRTLQRLASRGSVQPAEPAAVLAEAAVSPGGDAVGNGRAAQAPGGAHADGAAPCEEGGGPGGSGDGGGAAPVAGAASPAALG